MNDSKDEDRPYSSRRESPSVIASFPSLKRGQTEFKIRVLRYSKSEPLLDIREYVQSENFTGFTRKGVALSWDNVHQLEDLIPAIKKAMDEA